MENNSLKLFEDKKIRTHWDDEKEEWFFSIVDVCEVLTDQPDQRRASKYWSVLKTRLKKEGSELTTNCSQLKMVASDGKNRLTDVADTKGLLRIIQSIPSPKAEPFKMWLALVGSERLDEIADPELAINRAVNTYRQKGYSESWINQRLKTIEMRKELTDEWRKSGVKEGREYAILTNEISKAWSGMTAKEYKKHKNLKKENLRDNMNNMELVLNMLAEVTTTEISKAEKPQGFQESKSVALRGGSVAKNARDNIENQTGKSVISSSNSKQINVIEDGDLDE
ncbi:MAG: Bro-N domain-containing protein [Clostridia bacterium]